MGEHCRVACTEVIFACPNIRKGYQKRRHTVCISYAQENVTKYDTALNDTKQKAFFLDQRCTYCELHLI